MIHVCQGHEKGVGVEIFLKSLLKLPREVHQKIVFYVHKETLENNLKNLEYNFQIKGSSLKFFDYTIELKFFNSSLPQSTESLLMAIKNINQQDILLTLPTSKDQLIYETKSCAGYTEFFRNYFDKAEVAMLFKGPRDIALLITDHIPLDKVSNHVTADLIRKKISLTLNEYKKYFNEIDHVVLSGLNPHSGEDGVLGKQELNLKEIFESEELKIEPDFFVPGDTLHFHKNNQKTQLFTYMFHDQGLAYFKDRNGLLGLNISLGLPFLRISVDHGTAFSLYGKNIADSSGCFFALKEAYKVLKNVDK